MKLTLSTIAEISDQIQTGKTPPSGQKEYFNGNISWYTPGDLDKNICLSESERTITPKAFADKKAVVFLKRTVLISCIGDIGKAGICSLDKSSSNQQITGIMPKKFMCSEYLYYWVRASKKLLEHNANNAVVPILNNASLKRTKIKYPSIYDQNKIVQILDTADSLRYKRKEQLNLLDDYLESVFLEMFGDPVRNEKKWEKTLLQTTFSKEKEGTKCGPFGSALKKHEYVSDGVPVWNMDNITTAGFIKTGYLFITEEKYQELKTYSVSDGDIIISRAGTVGKMCVVHGIKCPSIISTNLIRLSLDSELIKPEYFISLLKYCKGRIGRLRTGADGAYSFMNTGMLKTLEIPLPPMVVQKKFISIMNAVEQTKQKMSASLDEMDNHFNALMQRYFG